MSCGRHRGVQALQTPTVASGEQGGVFWVRSQLPHFAVGVGEGLAGDLRVVFVHFEHVHLIRPLHTLRADGEAQPFRICRNRRQRASLEERRENVDQTGQKTAADKPMEAT